MTKHEYFLNTFDPGGDTGMALLRIAPEDFELVDHRTVPYRPGRTPLPTAVLREWQIKHPGRHHLLGEDFHVRNTRSAAATDATAIKVISSIDEMLEDDDFYEEVVYQEPVAGKHMVTDRVLEELGLHMGHAYSQRHVRDALRHAVSLLADRSYLPVCRKAFPPGGLAA